jgi:hypothetical protein
MTYPFDVFQRRDTDEDELQEAAAHLGPVAEPPSFWSTIANDESMPAAHRALALVELVRRHVVPKQTTVGAFAQMLNGAPWLAEDDLAVATEITGKVPVDWSHDDTVAVISLPGQRGAIYLVISGSHSAVEIATAMRGQPSDPRIDSAIICQIGFSLRA